VPDNALTQHNALLKAADDARKLLRDTINVHGCKILLAGCFAAGTKLLTREGWRAVETLREGDEVASRPENDVYGSVSFKPIEEVFVRTGRVLHLHLSDDQTIRTTPEHPFWVEELGWTPADMLRTGMRLATLGGEWVSVEEAFDTGEYETVYNCRVAEHHTYFVGDDTHVLAVWAHNQYLHAERTMFNTQASITSNNVVEELIATVVNHREQTNLRTGRNVAAIKVDIATGTTGPATATEYWVGVSSADRAIRYRIVNGSLVNFGEITFTRADAGLKPNVTGNMKLHSERVLLAALHSQARQNPTTHYRIQGFFTELAPCGSCGGHNCSNILALWSSCKRKVGEAKRPETVHVVTNTVYFSRLYPNTPSTLPGEGNPRRYHMDVHREIAQVLVPQNNTPATQQTARQQTLVLAQAYEQRVHQVLNGVNQWSLNEIGGVGQNIAYNTWITP
jgi:hypothetical protein